MNLLKQNYTKILWAIGVIIVLALFFNNLGDRDPAEQESIIKKPHNLTEGQCVIQVLGEKDKLFEEMKEKCRILVVLDKDGTILEIIEKEDDLVKLLSN